MPFKTASGKLLYRVGDVIISTNSENPSKWYGGTWELFAPGRTLVCLDTSQAEFNAIKKTGGSKYMQQHNHSGSIGDSGWHNHSASTDSTGNHRHIFDSRAVYNGSGSANAAVSYTAGSSNYYTSYAGSHSHGVTVNGAGTHSHSLSVSNTGSGNAQNLQPYMVVYMWIRVA